MIVIDVCDFLELILVFLKAFDLTVKYHLEFLSLATKLLFAGQIVSISARTRSCLCHVFVLFI